MQSGINLENFKSQNGYTINDTWYPRVTSILQIKAKPSLYRWYANQPSYESANKVKFSSASEGTTVHEIIEKILKGEENIKINNGLVPSIQAFLRFKKQYKIETRPNWIEQRIKSNKERFAGTLDVLARINDKLGILDIKTSKFIYRDYHMQTAAYIYAVNEDGFSGVKLPESIEKRWVLRIDQSRVCQKCGARSRLKGGKESITGAEVNCEHEFGSVEGEFEFLELEPPEHDYKAFLAAKELWQWENVDILKEIGYLK